MSVSKTDMREEAVVGLAMVTETASASDMRFEVKAAAELTDGERAAWADMRAKNPALYSPYYDFEYARIVSKLRDDVRVIIWFNGKKPAAFLPVQGKRFARPVGAPMTDYHGVICAVDTPVDMADMLAAAGIGAYHYDALAQTSGAPALDPIACSAIDLTGGGDNWRGGKDGSYRRHLKNLRRRIRNSETDHGDITAALQTQDKDVYAQLIEWKRAQYARTGKYDVLSADWTRGLLETLMSRSGENLRTDMHALYFGDRLAAVDMGITDGVTYHSWMTAYDPELRNYSPGMQLLEKIIDAAGATGYTALDLGPGLDGYKKHYADEKFPPVSSGFIAAGGPAAALSKLYGAAEAAAERAPIGGLSRLPGKLRRRYGMISACDPTFSGRAKALVSAAVDSGKSAPESD